jgi:hypothetical protein
MMGPGMMGPGYGMMGPGMMGPGYGMGYGMMGQGYGMGPGMMGRPGGMWALPQDLTKANVEHMLGHQLAWSRNPDLKLGKVEEKDANTIVADIVGKDGSVVRRLEFDRHTGWAHPIPVQ